MFSMTKDKMRGVNLILSVIVVFGLLFTLVNAAPVIPDDTNNNDDGTSIRTFELDNGAGAAATPNFIFSPVVAAFTDDVVDTIGGGVLGKPNSSPRVWRITTTTLIILLPRPPLESSIIDIPTLSHHWDMTITTAPTTWQQINFTASWTDVTASP